MPSIAELLTALEDDCEVEVPPDSYTDPVGWATPAPTPPTKAGLEAARALDTDEGRDAFVRFVRELPRGARRNLVFGRAVVMSLAIVDPLVTLLEEAKRDDAGAEARAISSALAALFALPFPRGPKVTLERRIALFRALDVEAELRESLAATFRSASHVRAESAPVFEKERVETWLGPRYDAARARGDRNEQWLLLSLYLCAPESTAIAKLVETLLDLDDASRGARVDGFVYDHLKDMIRATRASRELYAWLEHHAVPRHRALTEVNVQKEIAFAAALGGDVAQGRVVLATMRGNGFDSWLSVAGEEAILAHALETPEVRVELVDAVASHLSWSQPHHVTMHRSALRRIAAVHRDIVLVALANVRAQPDVSAANAAMIDALVANITSA